METAATPRALSTKEADIQMMLAAEVHLGTKSVDFQMQRYVFRRRNDGIYIINLGKTWEKLLMAARVIVAIENPQDIIVQSARPYGQRAVLKFAQYTGAHAIAGRHTPGTFTNQLQTSFSEPRLLILTDPRTDHQPIKEAALGNIPTIAFCDTDSPMRYVDIGIPANNKGKHSIGCLFWLLARMVLQMRNSIPQGHKWDIMVDLFFYREPEESKEQQEEEAPVQEYGDYGTAALGMGDQWSQLPEAQWQADQPAISGAVATGWTPDAVLMIMFSRCGCFSANFWLDIASYKRCSARYWRRVGCCSCTTESRESCCHRCTLGMRNLARTFAPRLLSTFVRF